MSKYKYSKTEQQINNVLKYHDEELKKIKTEQPSMLLVKDMHLNQFSQRRNLKQMPKKSVC